MQSVSSRIWTRVTVSNSYDDYNYTTGTSLLVCMMGRNALFCPQGPWKVPQALSSYSFKTRGWLLFERMSHETSAINGIRQTSQHQCTWSTYNELYMYKQIDFITMVKACLKPNEPIAPKESQHYSVTYSWVIMYIQLHIAIYMFPVGPHIS